MAKYEITRTFPAAEIVQIGQIFENPQWVNLPLLIDQGYVRLIEEAKETPDKPKENKKGKK